MPSKSPKTVVVTGANRGIGLAIVHELVKDKDIKIIIASARDVEKATDLKSINDPRIHILPLSVTSDESMDDFVKKVTEIVGDDGLNLLVNNAGAGLMYGTISRSILTEQFDVNTFSVILLTQKLLPLLTKAASKQSGEQLSVSRAAIINMSSGTASIAQNTRGSNILPMLAYSMSKTALNMFTKTLSVDLKEDGILAVAFAPGWIKTNIGGENADFTLEEAIPVLVSSFYKLDGSHSGGYLQRDLTPTPY